MRGFLLIAGLAALAGTAGAASLREAKGLLQVRLEGSDRWQPAGALPRNLKAGDAVRTGYGARALIALDGGAALEVGANTQLALDRGAGEGVVVNLLFGSVRVSSRFFGGRPLDLRTPTVTARPRSEAAAWRTVVVGGGTTAVEVEDGLVAVEDARGSALRLRAGERVESDLAGVREPEAVPAPARARRDDFAGRMRRELALDREGDAVQKLVAGEARRTEYELGRALTDAAGMRVRAEEFVVRTGAASFSFVALNGRRAGGISYFSWAGAFDRALPADLSGVFAVLPGTAGSAAPWTLTSFTETRSNGSDALVVRGVGGHQVDLNANADPTDDVSVLFNPVTDAFADVSGRAVYKVLFDGLGVYANGVLKHGLTGSGITSPNDAAPATNNDPITGAALAAPLPVYTANVAGADAASGRITVGESYGDGTSITVDDRSIGQGGAGAALDASSGMDLQSALLRAALEQTITASEFGRPVDLMISPRFLIETKVAAPALFQTGGLP